MNTAQSDKLKAVTKSLFLAKDKDQLRDVVKLHKDFLAKPKVQSLLSLAFDKNLEFEEAAGKKHQLFLKKVVQTSLAPNTDEAFDFLEAKEKKLKDQLEKLLFEVTDFADLKKILHRHKDLLLTDEAEIELDLLKTHLKHGSIKLEDKSSDYHCVRLDWFISIIQKARKHGIESAFEHLKEEERLLSEAVNQFLSSRSKEKMLSILEENSNILISDLGIQFVEGIITREKRKMVAFVLKAKLELLKKVKKDGIKKVKVLLTCGELFQKLILSKDQTELSSLIKKELNLIVTESMGEVAKAFISNREISQELKIKYHIIRGEIIKELNKQGANQGMLRPEWLDTRKDYQSLATADFIEEAEKDFEGAIKKNPELMTVALELFGKANEGSPKQTFKRERKKVPPGLSNLMGKNSNFIEKLFSESGELEKIGVRRRDNQTYYEHWLIYPTPWISDLDLPKYYSELGASLSVNYDRSYQEIQHVRTQLERLEGQAHSTRWVDLHRRLAYLYLIVPSANRYDHITIGLEHCKRASRYLKKKDDPIRWANMQALYGELYLAYFVHSTLGAVERKLRIIESSSIGRLLEFWAEYQRDSDFAQRAIGRYELALQVYDPKSNLQAWASALTGLASAIVLSNQENPYLAEQEALRHFHSAISATQDCDDSFKAIIYARLGFCSQFFKLSSIGSDKTHLKQAVKIWESKESQIRFEGATAFLAIHAFEKCEWAIAGEYIDKLLKHYFDNSKRVGLSVDQLSRISYLLSLKAYASVQQDKFNEALVSFEKSIRVLQLQDLPDNHSTLIKGIPKGMTAAALLITEHGSELFLIPGGTETLTRAHVIPVKELTDKLLSECLIEGKTQAGARKSGWLRVLATWKELPTDPKRMKNMLDVWQNVLKKLGEILIPKVLTNLKENTKSISFIVHKGLAILPLHALYTNEDGKADNYISEQIPISYVSSFSNISTPKDLKKSEKKFLGVLPSVGAKLKYAQKECETAAKHFDKKLKLEEDQASRQEVISHMAKYPYVHFPCHGEADWENYLNSSLFLQDGRLSILELSSQSNLDGIRLIALSACESGVTDIKYLPNANLGLVGALRDKGVKAVLSSSWPVSDSCTYLIMKKFYEEHIKNGKEPTESLSLAQSWVRKLNAGLVESELGEKPETIEKEKGYPYSHPYYWASFRLTGF